MNKCTDCQNETICTGNRRKGSHANCFQPKPMTNFERIKKMSVEEMAEFIKTVALGTDWLKGNITKWLEAEVEE